MESKNVNCPSLKSSDVIVLSGKVIQYTLLLYNLTSGFIEDITAAI